VPDWQVPDLTCSVQLVELRPFNNHNSSNNHSAPQSSTASRSINPLSSGGGAGPAANPAYAFQLSEPTTFHASRDSPYVPRFTPDGRGLVVRAHFVDVIANLGLGTYSVGYLSQSAVPEAWWEGVPLVDGLDAIVEQNNVLQSWIDLMGADDPGRRYFTGEGMLDVLWQTMLGGHFTRPWEQERQEFMTWYTASKKMRALFTQFRGNSRALRTTVLLAYGAYKKMTGGFAAKGSFLTRATSSTGNRAAFATAYHGYVGMAVQGSRVGDSLAILEGAPVPFIVRKAAGPLGNAWHVIGACYVHGCMRGDVFDPMRCVDLVLV
jgi:hypothetical protein